MGRPRKDHKQFSIRIDAALYDRLCSHIRETGTMKTLAVEKALEMYLDEYDRKMAILRKYDKGQDEL